MIKVGIVDGSAVVRYTLGEILTADSGISVIASASDPIIALNLFRKNWPDVIILDMDTNRKDGLTFLREVMEKNPTPVLMTMAESENWKTRALDAVTAGAIDVIIKPETNLGEYIRDSATMFKVVVKYAAYAQTVNYDKKNTKKRFQQVAIAPKLSADVILKYNPGKRNNSDGDTLIAIGASAGGTKTLEALFKELPETTPPIVVVQHMPKAFTCAFAERLNALSQIVVSEGEDGVVLKAGNAYVAPGDTHMVVQRAFNDVHYSIRLVFGDYVNRHRPAVDVLFRSVAMTAGNNALGILLTGMGDDGANGMVEMKNVGITTIAQDSTTSIVFGMPKEAIARGGAMHIMPLSQITRYIIDFSRKKNKCNHKN